MSDYALPRPSAICALSGRDLRPGDRFVGVLTEDAGKFVRKDYAAEAWQGTPAGAVAHWIGRIPATGSAKKPTLDDGRLFDCFDHLAGATEPEKLSFRYVTALLLMRRKKLQFVDARKNPQGADVLVLRDARSGATVEVIDPKLGEAEAAAVQAEVLRILD